MLQPVHPQLKKIFEYWLSKKGEKLAPRREDIDPTEIQPLLPFVGLVDVLRDPLRFRYRLAGTAIVQSYGREVTGKYLDEIDLNGHQHAIIAEYKKVVEEKEASCATWEFTRHDGRHLRYERLALPLSSDGKIIDMLFGGAVFDAAYG